MKLDMKDTESLLALFQNGKGLLNFVNEKLPYLRNRELRESNSQIDKHEDGFYYNEDPCQSMNIRQLCFKSFSGSFGSSSVYSDIAGLNMDLMKTYFLKYLNKHKDDILREIGDMMISDAKEIKAQALSEIDKIRRNIEKIFPEISDEEDHVQ